MEVTKLLQNIAVDSCLITVLSHKSNYYIQISFITLRLPANKLMIKIKQLPTNQLMYQQN